MALTDPSEVAAIFDTAEGAAVVATYTPDGGAPATVNLIPLRGTAGDAVGRGEVRAVRNLYLAPAPGIAGGLPAEPRIGDAVAVGAETFTVKAKPVRDDLAQVYRLELRKE